MNRMMAGILALSIYSSLAQAQAISPKEFAYGQLRFHRERPRRTGSPCPSAFTKIRFGKSWLIYAYSTRKAL